MNAAPTLYYSMVKIMLLCCLNLRLLVEYAVTDWNVTSQCRVFPN